jgi:hypothetical protein
MSLLIVLIVIIIVCIAFQMHAISEQCKHCKKCKDCRYCKKYWKLAHAENHIKPIKRLDLMKKKIIEETIKQNKKEFESTKKLKEDKKTHFNITEDQLSIVDDYNHVSANIGVHPKRIQQSIGMLYDEAICPGDDRLFKKAQHMSNKNKDAIHHRAKYDKNALLPYIREELDANENREWWDSTNEIV